ncbi:grasp-with-spasm system SPASM domain peptide maturase [Chryseolinea sp. H1M3-3]|uniref:grasp-with-spasm system SPASM domain peptide maturase n=1 Tax=Chryseolinea sp. H1M3-3 TaxID=3034144 RepID=UPI0023EC3C58|nr:grasp-with-spasm system SPASM domain peptide maturase [Chryseolinea sp. H1M3-3]
MIFKLFACCIPVSGARRSIICDIQRGTYKFIPNILYDILTTHKDKSIESIKSTYGHKYSDELDSYFLFLEQNEFGFWCDDPKRFPDIKMEWMHPSAITNAIIDIDATSHHDYSKIRFQLDDLGCQALQLRIYDEIEPQQLRNIISEFNDSRLRSIDVVIKYSNNLTVEVLSELCQSLQRVRSVQIHSSPELKKVQVFGIKTPLNFLTEEINDHTHCGVVNASYFVANVSSFTESLHYNSCLNRKIGIDIHGNIKNCPSFRSTFGNIKDSTLREALDRPGFKDFWNVTKDSVTICCDCEFRYICMDCRAFTKDNEKHGKPEKCNYDPYTAKWAS